MIKKDKINRGGRKKGSVNKVTASVRSAFNLLINDNLPRLQKDLDEMTAKDRVSAIISLSNFVIPKLNTIDFTAPSEDSFKPVQIYFDADDTDK